MANLKFPLGWSKPCGFGTPYYIADHWQVHTKKPIKHQNKKKPTKIRSCQKSHNTPTKNAFRQRRRSQMRHLDTTLSYIISVSHLRIFLLDGFILVLLNDLLLQSHTLQYINTATNIIITNQLRIILWILLSCCDLYKDCFIILIYATIQNIQLIQQNVFQYYDISIISVNFYICESGL